MKNSYLVISKWGSLITSIINNSFWQLRSRLVSQSSISFCLLSFHSLLFFLFHIEVHALKIWFETIFAFRKTRTIKKREKSISCEHYQIQSDCTNTMERWRDGYILFERFIWLCKLLSFEFVLSKKSVNNHPFFLFTIFYLRARIPIIFAFLQSKSSDRQNDASV